MPNARDNKVKNLADLAAGYTITDAVALVVLRSGDPARRWQDATRLRAAELGRLDPATILFVEYDAVSRRFSLLHLRWSDSLLSYCYSGSTVLSEAMTVALGLRSLYWRDAVARLMRNAELPPAKFRRPLN